MTSNTMVQDDYANTPTELSRNRQGTFVSALQIKYQKGGRQSGIKFFFEPMARITKIQFKYDILTDNISGSPVIIDTATTLNEGQQPAQRSITFTKQYGITNLFTNQISYTNNYEISQSIKVQIPFIKSVGVGGEMASTYSRSSAPEFAFGKEMNTVYKSTEKLMVIVPACKKVDVQTIINEQKMNIPYEATLTFVDRFTGDYIGKTVVRGIWNGVMTSTIRSEIKSYDIPNCLVKSESPSLRK